MGSHNNHIDPHGLSVFHHFFGGITGHALGNQFARFLEMLVNEFAHGLFSLAEQAGFDLALLRGQEQKAVVILGSATPAVTTWHRAREGEMGLLSLPRRVKEARLPSMEVVDMRRAGRLAGGFMSPRLRQVLKETMANGRQAILFLNRRGYAPALLCPSCGQTVGCPACSVSLTLHRSKARLLCHTCGHQRPVPQTCPNGDAPGEELKPLGLGTEAVVETLEELEPGLRIARLDSDTAANPAKLRAVLKQISKQEVEVVVGTQMITKGHHFPLISLGSSSEVKRGYLLSSSSCSAMAAMFLNLAKRFFANSKQMPI